MSSDRGVDKEDVAHTYWNITHPYKGKKWGHFFVGSAHK